MAVRDGGSARKPGAGLITESDVEPGRPAAGSMLLCFIKAFYELDTRRVCFLLKGGHDRDGPLLAEGRLLSGHEVSSWRWARGGRRIDRRPAPVAAAD